MFGGHGAITQGNWDERKTFEYRYPTLTEKGLFGCIARFRLFFVYGFTIDDPGLLPEAKLAYWITPS